MPNTSLVRSRQVLLPALVLLMGTAACEQAKSSNPLSPLIAGPLAGVTISLPKSLEPVAGLKIEDRNQPITLLIENPSSNSPRPFTLRLEVATSTTFQTLVHSRSGIEPGPNGRTSYQLLEKLAHGYTYHWRVRAEDGANASAWSTPITREEKKFDSQTDLTLRVPEMVSFIGELGTVVIYTSSTLYYTIESKATTKEGGSVRGVKTIVKVGPGEKGGYKVIQWMDALVGS